MIFGLTPLSSLKFATENWKVSIFLQNTFYLDSLIIYLSNEESFGTSGHYVCIKLVGQKWLLLNDERVFEIAIPTQEINIYMAFFRRNQRQDPEFQKFWPQKRFKKMSTLEVKATLGIELHPQAHPRPTTSRANAKKVEINEAVYDKPKATSAFTEKVKNRPKLLEKPAVSTTRRKPPSDDDYDPADDEQDTEDTIDDMELENETVTEKADKSNYTFITFYSMTLLHVCLSSTWLINCIHYSTSSEDLQSVWCRRIPQNCQEIERQ